MANRFLYGSLDEAVKAFKEGRSVWTIEMGGLGPGYEQCIQVLAWTIIERFNGKKIDAKTFNKAADPIVSELDKKLGGFSGAQVGVAVNLAYHFLSEGYEGVLTNSQVKDRHIQFSNDWEYIKRDDGKS
jgi:hypothetical protein